MCLALEDRALALVLSLRPRPQTKAPEGPARAAQRPQTWRLWESQNLLAIASQFCQLGVRGVLREALWSISQDSPQTAPLGSDVVCASSPWAYYRAHFVEERDEARKTSSVSAGTSRVRRGRSPTCTQTSSWKSCVTLTLYYSVGSGCTGFQPGRPGFWAWAPPLLSFL